MINVQSTTPGKRGRPRNTHADGAIVAATLDLVADVGISGLRVEDVSARAGVGRSAIYRRYESKSSLVAAAIAALVSEISLPDTGSTRDDLLALMADAVAVYSDPLRAGVMPSLVAAMRHEPELASAIREGFLTKRRDALRAVLERGVARGDLRADLDTELALDVLGGPLFYRLLITGGPLDASLVEGVADLILRGFAPTPRAKERRR
jgi:AcrR family transcriptional regulator